MAVPDWTVQFDLTNPYSGTLSLNQETPTGYYQLDQEGCSLDFDVRSTKDNVPQANGSKLHHRFLTGAEMPLTVQLWETDDQVACDELLASMLDRLIGSVRSLLNSGDNEGRIAWPVAGNNQRMLDDVRMLVYPKFVMRGATPIVTFTLDSEYPYAQDLNQTLTTILDGATDTLSNTGSADYQPVFKVYGPTSAFTLTNLTTGIDFTYDAGLPGAVAIGGGNYAEIDTTRDTIFLNGSGANLKAGVDELASDYWALIVGDNDVTITGADVDVLWAPAWG